MFQPSFFQIIYMKDQLFRFANPSCQLPDSANKKMGSPVKFEFQIINSILILSMPGIINSINNINSINSIINIIYSYIKIKFYWVSCILSGNSTHEPTHSPYYAWPENSSHHIRLIAQVWHHLKWSILLKEISENTPVLQLQRSWLTRPWVGPGHGQFLKLPRQG